MKGGRMRMGAADRGLLPEGRLAGPMPWVIAIMMLLTVLAAAGGLRLQDAASALEADIGNRLTVQIVEPNPDLRRTQAGAALAALASAPGVISARAVPKAELQELLEPWLGAGGLESDVPVPEMIDVDLSPAAYAAREGLAARVRADAPSARVDDNARWLAPLAQLIATLQWLAAALVLLMIGASAATVMLAARAALDTHRGTIEILHLMGATDLQVARLFQRRIALDAMFGGIAGLVGAAIILVLVGSRVGALGSDLLGGGGFDWRTALLLFTLPAAGVLLATLTARATILRALGRML